MEKRCELCKHWDLADAAPTQAGRIDPNDPTAGTEDWERWKRVPHANQNWSKCSAAPEGFADELNAAEIRMAVWDGSNYMARLLTRCDHVCGEFAPRE